MTKALILFSGGQDSTTCLYWAKQKFDELVAIGFDYGQMHVKELEQAKKIAGINKIDYKIYNIKNLLSSSSSSLINSTNHNQKSRVNSELPASFVAGRNILFLSIAGSYASELGINDIITGVCETDYSGYPDCRRTSIDAMEEVLSLAYGSGNFRIHTPLMNINKAQTWKLAKELNCLDIIINETLTDYNGDLTMNEWGMGTNNNPATKLRLEGFYEAKNKGWI